MDLDQLANLGEFIGGVAVLVTLLYLAIQVRGSAREQRVASMLAATRELAAVTQSITSTNERAEIWLGGLADFGALAPAQRLRFSAILGHYLRHIEQLYYQNRGDRVEPEVYEGFVQQLHDFVAYPGFESWWPTRRHWFGREFQAFVDAHMGADNTPRLYGETSQ